MDGRKGPRPGIGAERRLRVERRRGETDGGGPRLMIRAARVVCQRFSLVWCGGAMGKLHWGVLGGTLACLTNDLKAFAGSRGDVFLALLRYTVSALFSAFKCLQRFALRHSGMLHTECRGRS